MTGQPSLIQQIRSIRPHKLIVDALFYVKISLVMTHAPCDVLRAHFFGVGINKSYRCFFGALRFEYDGSKRPPPTPLRFLEVATSVVVTSVILGSEILQMLFQTLEENIDEFPNFSVTNIGILDELILITTYGALILFAMIMISVVTWVFIRTLSSIFINLETIVDIYAYCVFSYFYLFAVFLAAMMILISTFIAIAHTGALTAEPGYLVAFYAGFIPFIIIVLYLHFYVFYATFKLLVINPIVALRDLFGVRTVHAASGYGALCFAYIVMAIAFFPTVLDDEGHFLNPEATNAQDRRSTP